MSIRTDLAIEAKEMFSKDNKEVGEIEGVIAKEEKKDGVKITKIEIINENGERALNKPCGKYITIEAPDLKYSNDIYENTCREIAKQIREIADINPSTKTLVVGLGNKKITPDALGPVCVSKLMITNHMKEHMKDFFDDNITSVCAISPGVLGTTGMETLKIIKGVAEEIKPDLIICVDALASKSLDRISKTFQISDTGINPGSGVDNKRERLDKETLGVEVISLGVPTVVDAHTIAFESIESVLDSCDDEEMDERIKRELSENIESLMVTPKDIDSVIEKTAKTVANGINLALHKNLTFEDIESFVL